MKLAFTNKKVIYTLLILAVIAVSAYTWTRLQDNGPGDGFVNGNGRLEATEIDISTKLAGRIDDILVNEGDFVRSGQCAQRANSCPYANTGVGSSAC